MGMVPQQPAGAFSGGFHLHSSTHSSFKLDKVNSKLRRGINSRQEVETKPLETAYATDADPMATRKTVFAPLGQAGAAALTDDKFKKQTRDHFVAAREVLNQRQQ